MPTRRSSKGTATPPDGEAKPEEAGLGSPAAASPEPTADTPEAPPLPEDSAPVEPAPAEAVAPIPEDPVPPEPAADPTPLEPALGDPAADTRPPADLPPEPVAETPPVELPPEPPAPEPEPVSEPPAEPRTPEPAQAAEIDEHHEEEGMSWAARLLLVLVLLLAGAGLGIWAAPKLAPALPAGLAPVAQWLTPGQGDVQAKLTELEARIGTTASDLQARLADVPSATDIDGRVSSAVGDTEARLAGEITALRDSVGRSVDTTALQQRLDRAESGLEGQAAELATLKQQLEGTADVGGQISEDAIAKIDVYRAELDGLRAELGTLRDQVGGLSARLDQVAAEADRQVSAAQDKVDEIQTEAETRLSAAQVSNGLAQIRAAITAGEPFPQPLAQLSGQPGVAVPEGLTATAESGVVTLATLRDGYPDAAHTAIRASITAGAGDGLLARTRAFLEAQVASRSLSPQQGQGTDAVLSRMEDRLRQDDLDGVLAEAEALPSEAKAAMGDWLESVRQRASAVDGLAALDSSLAATN